MKRLTISRVARWQADCEKLAHKQRQLAEDVKSYVMSAKGGRYSKLNEIRSHLREAEASLNRAEESVVMLMAAEARRTTTPKGSE